MDEGWEPRQAGCRGARLAQMKSKCTLRILEVGYGGDHKSIQKRHEKRRQHATLAAALRGEGWRVELTPLVLGHCGSVFAQEMEAMAKLGLSKAKVDTLFTNLHTNAIRSLLAVARCYMFLKAAKYKELELSWRKPPPRPKQPP